VAAVLVAAATSGGGCGRRRMWWLAGGGLWRSFFYCLYIFFVVRQKLHGKEMCFLFLCVVYFVCSALNTTQQSAFAVRATERARQRGIVVQKFVVRPLPCVSEKNARQRLYRAFFVLWRAPDARQR
jgi:hypothetical protein